MYIIRGKYNIAKIMLADNQFLDEATTSQIYSMLANPAFKGKPIVIMPDAHKGSGSCIGFTMPMNDHVIPNVVGVDISCGVDGYNLGKLELTYNDLNDFYNYIIKNIPSGFNVREKEVDTFHHDWAQSKDKITDLCRKMDIKEGRVWDSIGTLGGGNHYIELNKDPEDNVWLTIHSGSRNFGLQVCNYHQGKAKNLMQEVFIGVAYKGLEFLPLAKGGSEYLEDMQVAQEYARVNRDVMAEIIWADYFGKRVVSEQIKTVHNYINFKDNIVRKGAISAQKDERVLIPLNMRDGIIVRRGKGNSEWNFSAPHGAGRVLSRSQAKKEITLEKMQEDMKGIFSKSIGMATIDEAPDAYKNADDIIDAIGPTIDIDFIMNPIFNFKAG